MSETKMKYSQLKPGDRFVFVFYDDKTGPRVKTLDGYVCPGDGKPIEYLDQPDWDVIVLESAAQPAHWVKGEGK